MLKETELFLSIGWEWEIIKINVNWMNWISIINENGEVNVIIDLISAVPTNYSSKWFCGLSEVWFQIVLWNNMKVVIKNELYGIVKGIENREILENVVLGTYLIFIANV